jgi:hypothetical protein
MLACEGGSLILFDHIDPPGPMWAGEGRREVTASVGFTRPFSGPPVVHPSITLIDGDARSNLRLDIALSDVTPQGFRLTARTWSDTRIGRLAVSWIALGERPQEDDEAWRL